MEHFPSVLTRIESDALVERIEEQWRVDGWGLWAVEVVGGPEFVGFVGLNRVTFDVPFTGAVEIGWRLARAAWGLGYASEAARAVLGVAFGPVGLGAVVSMTTTTNRRSQAVMVRLGMHRDPGDDFDHPRVPPGSLRRHILYRLSQEQWTAAGA
jgi:RimJ/RimL family protein N-acetyltransferase